MWPPHLRLAEVGAVEEGETGRLVDPLLGSWSHGPGRAGLAADAVLTADLALLAGLTVPHVAVVAWWDARVRE